MPTSPRKKTRSLESQFQRVSLNEENSGKEPGKVTESQNYQPLAKGKVPLTQELSIFDPIMEKPKCVWKSVHTIFLYLQIFV